MKPDTLADALLMLSRSLLVKGIWYKLLRSLAKHVHFSHTSLLTNESMEPISQHHKGQCSVLSPATRLSHEESETLSII